MDLTTDRPDVMMGSVRTERKLRPAQPSGVGAEGAIGTVGDTSLPTYLRPYAEELDRWHVEVLLARTRRAAGRSAPRYDDQSNASIA